MHLMNNIFLLNMVDQNKNNILKKQSKTKIIIWF